MSKAICPQQERQVNSQAEAGRGPLTYSIWVASTTEPEERENKNIVYHSMCANFDIIGKASSHSRDCYHFIKGDVKWVKSFFFSYFMYLHLKCV